MKQLLLRIGSLRQLVGYGLVSLCALSLDTGTLLLLVWYAHVEYLAAATLSFVLGTLLAHGLSVRFVFTFRRMRVPAAELAVFGAIGLLGLIVNDSVIAGAVGLAGLSILLAKLLAAAASFFVNYTLRHRLLFRRPPIDLTATQLIESVAE